MSSIMHSRSASASMQALKVDTTLTAKAAGNEPDTPVSAGTVFEEDYDSACEAVNTTITQGPALSSSDSIRRPTLTTAPSLDLLQTPSSSIRHFPHVSTRPSLNLRRATSPDLWRASLKSENGTYDCLLSLRTPARVEDATSPLNLTTAFETPLSAKSASRLEGGVVKLRSELKRLDEKTLRQMTTAQLVPWLRLRNIDEDLIESIEHRGVDGRKLVDWQNLDDGFLAELLDTVGTPRQARPMRSGSASASMQALKVDTTVTAAAAKAASAPEVWQGDKATPGASGALHNRHSASWGSTSAGAMAATDRASTSQQSRSTPNDLTTLTIVEPPKPTTVMGVMETLPEWHECDDSDNCPTWQWRYRIVVDLETRHGVKIADGLEGDIYIVERSDGLKTVAKVLNHDGAPTLNRKMFPYSPSCSSQHRMSLQSPPLSATLASPVQPAQRRGMSLEKELPSIPLARTPSASTSASTAQPSQAPSNASRRMSKSSLQRLPRLNTSGPSSSAPALKHFPSIPLLRSTASTQQLRPTLHRSTNSAPTVRRTSAESIRAMFSPSSTLSPDSKSRRSKSLDLKTTLTTVAEDAVVEDGGSGHPNTETLVRTGNVPNFAGWMKRRKDKLIHQEWQLQYGRIHGSKLTLHKTDRPEDTKAIKTLDLTDYNTTCGGPPSKIDNTKLNVLLKALKRKPRPAAHAPADSPSVFELVPLPGCDTKVYHFAVADDRLRNQWMKETKAASRRVRNTMTD